METTQAALRAVGHPPCTSGPRATKGEGAGERAAASTEEALIPHTQRARAWRKRSHRASYAMERTIAQSRLRLASPTRESIFKCSLVPATCEFFRDAEKVLQRPRMR